MNPTRESGLTQPACSGRAIVPAGEFAEQAPVSLYKMTQQYIVEGLKIEHRLLYVLSAYHGAQRNPSGQLFISAAMDMCRNHSILLAGLMGKKPDDFSFPHIAEEPVFPAAAVSLYTQAAQHFKKSSLDIPENRVIQIFRWLSEVSVDLAGSLEMTGEQVK